MRGDAILWERVRGTAMDTAAAAEEEELGATPPFSTGACGGAAGGGEPEGGEGGEWREGREWRAGEGWGGEGRGRGAASIMRSWARRRFAAATEAEDVVENPGESWCERSGGLVERSTMTALGRRQHRWRRRVGPLFRRQLR